MVTVKYAAFCDLCSQPVNIEGFTITVDDAQRTFCCAGCLSIYKLIYSDNLQQVQQSGLDTLTSDNKSKKEDN